MYQVSVVGAELGALLTWLQRHREGLSVLVHPLLGDVVAEHLEQAIWLGVPLSLDPERLQDARPASVALESDSPFASTILRIDASARRSGSHGRGLADALVRRLVEGMPGARVVHRDLAEGLPLLDSDVLDAWSIAPDRRTPGQAQAAEFSEALVAELKDADAIVLTLPIYNFHVPAAFKAWIDLVARARLTFRYTADGPVGLLADRPVYVIVTSGGTRLNGPLDFVGPWLRHVFGFLGLRDLRVIAADGLGAGAEQRLADAHAAIEQSVGSPVRRSA
jgi:FMN-dependent NADH-azoreductase